MEVVKSIISPVDRQATDLKVCSMDPLSFDKYLKKVGQLNQAKDVNGLAELLYQVLPTPAALEHYSFEEAAAAMRDLGILLGSIKRHGVEPVWLVPEIEFVLEILGHKNNLPPRDTLIHYTLWNPDGKRMRSYTQEPDELHLIHSVKKSTGPLMDAIYNMRNLHQISLKNPKFSDYAKQAHEGFKSMIDGVVHAKRFVSPAFFANELRYYYDPIHLLGKDWIGPGAVEMPVFVFDHLLWGSDCDDPAYEEFRQTYLPYILPEFRKIFKEYENKWSLLLKLLTYVENKKLNDTELANIKEVLKICTLLKSFRMPHKKLAEDSYKEENNPGRSKGSGGYSTDILVHIIKLCNAKSNRLKEALEKYQSVEL
ncbi:monodechloroaminopyrrolnitrin synthase PrnB family protein [Rapidithrix thailandica]|uniref:MarC n=1 Tax=Rapidithrix thailandica TaxID=413964 RepID=A0A494WKL3_9BACT|nr:MarC [Rapidithrix thailandica]